MKLITQCLCSNCLLRVSLNADCNCGSAGELLNPPWGEIVFRKIMVRTFMAAHGGFTAVSSSKDVNGF